MEFLTTWLTVLTVGFLVVITPGPNLAITMKNSLVYTKKAGIYTALGLAAGNLVHITYCLVGIGVLITQSILLFNTIKWIGAVYLIYIGIKALTARKQVQNSENKGQVYEMTRFYAFREGFLTDLLNPKATMFFLALFTQIIQPHTPIFAQVVYGLTVISTELVWFTILAVFVSHRIIKQRYLSASHIFERLTGFVLVALGVKLALTRGNS